MNTFGYIYVPTRCASGKQRKHHDDKFWRLLGASTCIERVLVVMTECRLHIAFHGCLQDVEFIQDVYVMNAG